MSIFTAALGPIANLAGSWLQGKADKNAAAAELKLTEAKAKAQILLSKETSVADWERIMAEGAKSSWKDEWFVIVLSIPLILAFIPGAEGWVDRGFEQLSKAPDWYFYSLGIAISASFGVRGAQAFLKGNDMSFKLSRRSLDRLEGIDDRLQAVVKMAITMTKTDFGVVQGMRTIEQQKELVDKGASQTMKSKHLEGKAFDIMAYINGRASWELSVYDDLADAIKEAATQMNVPICWGAAWGTPDMPYPMDIRKWEGTMEEAMTAYIDLRRSQGRRPFIDGPHFELID